MWLSPFSEWVCGYTWSSSSFSAGFRVLLLLMVAPTVWYIFPSWEEKASDLEVLMVVCASGRENDGFCIIFLYFFFQTCQLAVSFHKATFQGGSIPRWSYAPFLSTPYLLHSWGFLLFCLSSLCEKDVCTQLYYNRCRETYYITRSSSAQRWLPPLLNGFSRGRRRSSSSSSQETNLPN